MLNPLLLFLYSATELTTMYEYVTTFMTKTSSEKCWQQMFALKEKLQIQNILQLVEISLVIPISNAEVERMFSSFTKMMTRDR